jgi:hypothetical protein
MKDQIGRLLFHPGEVPGNLRRRWLDPIRATVAADGEFNEWPRFPLQVKDGVMRTIHFLPQLSRSSRS